MLLGAGAVATKTYVDDVFSTFLYEGNNSGQTINTGVNMTEGGLTWIKVRDGSAWHQVYDTERGAEKVLYSNNDNVQDTNGAGLTSFNNNGFSIMQHGGVGAGGSDYTSWSFRKAPGFFDVVTYTGNSTAYRAIDHQLGCVPGMLIVKRTDTSGDWQVLHKKHYGTTSNYSSLKLNSTAAEYDSWSEFNRTNPTATQFTVSNDPSVNATGGTYVCYLFAGGESIAATARSVDFDGSGDYLSVADSDDFCFESGAFTIEAWIKPTTITNKAFIAKWVSGQREWFFGTNSNELKFAYSTDGSSYTILDSGYDMQIGQWQHIAVTRDSSNKIRIFVDGIQRGVTHSVSATFNNSTQALVIAHNDDSSTWQPNAKISNVRIVKGTAVYTSSFRSPTEPLTNITNTKLLCCNNSSTTGSTVTPTTITANGGPTASTDSPFDDPAGFVFGDSGDQNVIKCGSYIGNGSTDGPEIFLGFEPQWVMLKNASSTGNWFMFDTMRGIVTGANDARLLANSNNAEYTQSDGTYIDLTSTGFKLTSASSHINGNGNTIIYCAIRRPDGYVGKPVELGTGVFAMDTGNSSSTGPVYDSNFAVDWALWRQPASSQDWRVHARLTGDKELVTNSTAAQGSRGDDADDDFNDGWGRSTNGSYPRNSNYQSWMWKRHAGFDVVAYEGNGVAGRQVPHSLSKTPEMMWVRRRNSTNSNWWIYHKGLNGGTTPEQYGVRLNTQDDEMKLSTTWDDTAPTSTHFTVGAYNNVNGNGDDIIALLFASVDGISKLGYYDGQYWGHTITTGFQPRFVWIRVMNNNGPFVVLDTTRGWGSGNDNYLDMSSNAAQVSASMGAPTSTGFLLPDNVLSVNTNQMGRKYMYYAHA